MGKKWEGEGKEIKGAEKVVILSLSSLRNYNRCYNLEMQIQVQQEKKVTRNERNQRTTKAYTTSQWSKWKEASRETSHEQCVNQSA